MSLFKNLILHNFQIHRDLTYEFKDGFSTIVGPSDTGKSSIQRALYGIVYNDITKDQVTEGTKSGYVSLELNEVGINETLKIEKITCFINNGQKYYEVIKEGQTIRYEKLSGQPIKEFYQLGIINQSLEDLGINLVFQKQTDPMFLVSDTKKTLSDLFNLSFGLDKYQQMSEHLKNKNKLMQNQINFIESEYNKLALVLEDNESERDSFLELDKKFTEHETKVNELQKSLDEVNQALQNIVKIRELKQQLNDITKKQETNKSLQSLLESLSNKLNQQLKLNVVKELNLVKVKQDRNTKFSSAFEKLNNKIDSFRKTKSFISLKKKQQILERISGVLGKLKIDLIRSSCLFIEVLNYSLNKISNSVDNLVERIRQSNYVCPKCGQLIGSGVCL